MRQSTSLDHLTRRAACMLLGGALFLAGASAYSHGLALAGYLLMVAAWWAIARPPLTTRRVRWPRRRR